MNDSECKVLLESIREILHEGPDDRFRSKLREAIDSILQGQMDVRELPDYLRPVLRRMAVSYQNEGKTGPLNAALALMRL